MRSYYDKDNVLLKAHHNYATRKFSFREKYYIDDNDPSNKVDNPNFDENLVLNSEKVARNENRNTKIAYQSPTFHKFIRALLKKELDKNPSDYNKILNDFKKVFDKYPMEP